MRTTALILLATAGACAGAPDPGAVTPVEIEIFAAPDIVTAAAVDALRAHGVPVGPANADAAFVQSEWFVLAGSWAGEPLESRVDCGRSAAGDPLAARDTVHLSINVAVRHVPTAQPATLVPRDQITGVRVRLVSKGGLGPITARTGSLSAAAARPTTPAPACTLTPAFAGALLDEIAERARTHGR